MPIITIYVSQSDIDAAGRIAKKMFPEKPDVLAARHIIGSAAEFGMKTMRVTWNDAEDQPNLTNEQAAGQ